MFPTHGKCHLQEIKEKGSVLYNQDHMNNDKKDNISPLARCETERVENVADQDGEVIWFRVPGSHWNHSLWFKPIL